MVDIISGEKVQNLCDIYVGFDEDFNYNPEIAKQKEKCLSIHSIPENWNNPALIFCYSHKISDFAKKVHLIQNPCVIVFGNSDQNISYDLVKPFLESLIVKHIFCQNIEFLHSKASFLPIGIANRMWQHGNPRYIEQINRNTLIERKTGHIFCNFSISTNENLRNKCLESMKKNGIHFCNGFSQENYIEILVNHKYSICPEGNGLDTHRFWESVYVRTIPIVTRSPLTEQIHASGIPCVLIDSWEEFSLDSLPEYSSCKFDDDLISLAKLRIDILERL